MVLLISLLKELRIVEGNGAVNMSLPAERNLSQGFLAYVMEPSLPLPKFFKTPTAFRKWLAANHAKSKELWVGFYKKNSGKPSITWPESVDEALCFGWIDGIRKNIDEDSYQIRFSPRKPSSIWSAVNIP